MSYINIPTANIPDFTQAVISLWFRVPQKSIDACIAQPPGPPQFGSLENNLEGGAVIPFVTFGGGLEQTLYTSEFVQYGTVRAYDNPSLTGDVTALMPLGADVPTDTGPATLDPSYIGLQCLADSLTVVVNLQTDQRATLTGWNIIPTGATNTHPDPSVDFYTITGVEDVSIGQTGAPEGYNIAIIVDASSFAGRWHHLLVSCDLSNSISTTETVGGSNKMWVALDDVNYNEYDAFPNWTGSGDPNAVLTRVTSLPVGVTPSDQMVNLVAPPVIDSFTGLPVSAANAFTPFDDGVIAAAASLPASNILVNSKPFGIPATPDQVSHIFNMEMAEFQMFTGVTLDTSVMGNRRAFIGGDGKPARYPAAAKLLGQKPDIAFVNTSQNWIAGRNSGAAGRAKPTGRIITYFPSPKLGV